MTRNRVAFALGLLCSLSLVGSCKSDDDDVNQYRDNRGRVCSVPLGVYNPKAECNKTPRPIDGCDPGSVPCFTLNPLLDTGQMRSCDTCCVNDYPDLPDYRDCAFVTCRTNEDCVYTNAHCVDSFCFFLPPAGGAGGGGAAGASAAGGGAPAVMGGAGGASGGTMSSGGFGAVSSVAGAGSAVGGSAPIAGSAPVAGASGVFGVAGAAGSAGRFGFAGFPGGI